MNSVLATILVEAKKRNKWVSAADLKKYGLNKMDLHQLEDEGLLLIFNHFDGHKALKLTLKGYRVFMQENMRGE
ncbi:hypothetical protein [Jeotgalibacillus proteolyticus]|uniref:Antirepressor protein C-terminal domain-containing protein n=1 Tax=Jeotgalibacillus proteolyticus TaxID=2082395 RepID=A0A2S5G8W3_9BACL|nr:hypothetical protein [Jeotgalibacillus proteolyticus]PPA69442.1 hypothetical protein C4B60_16810 [Jeotgalibacillus proteolyticus]